LPSHQRLLCAKGRKTPMRQQAKVQHLRELLSLAVKLRSSAAATTDQEYIELFLRTAAALEDRASRLAYGSADVALDPKTDASMHAPVNLAC
jgi:hypothetical protein